jgi:hypothetical protein
MHLLVAAAALGACSPSARSSLVRPSSPSATVAQQQLQRFEAEAALTSLDAPARSITEGGYKAPPEAVTWEPFRYALPHERREAVRAHVASRASLLPPLPPLRILLIGGVASGKGTLAPMLSQAFRARVIGVGALLRGEARAERPRGREAARSMAAGALLSDELVIGLLRERIRG